jgi:hypothetical protein
VTIQRSLTITLLDDPALLESFPAPSDWDALSRETIAEHAPDAALVALDDRGLRARCSLWWNNTPSLDDDRLGVIGHYGAIDAGAGHALLTEANAVLVRHRCTQAVGPMDGNSWRRYRFIIERGEEPPFFLEPNNPDDWPSHFTSAGFTPLAHYYSALNSDLSQHDPRAAGAAPRLANTGVTVRQLDLDRFEDELRGVYRVAAVSFRAAFLYTPLSESAFVAQYRKIRAYVRPELVFIAELAGEPVGFAFTVPDVNELLRTESVHTVIIKTVAILPDRSRFSGLGSVLVQRTHDAARELGFSRAIHALMHESNQSLAISARTGRPMRRYAIFARDLARG